MQHGRRLLLALLTHGLDRLTATSPRARRALTVLGTLAVTLATLVAIPGDACATTPDLHDGRAHVIVGRPATQPSAQLRRIYPTNTVPRGGVTLRAGRATMPRYWETHELDTVRAWAQRRGWRTSETRRGGIDITPHLTGKEYRVDRFILTAMNATARAGGGTCTIISGWRDSTKQLMLWKLFQAGIGNPANRPGTSLHEAEGPGYAARAADVYCGSRGVAFWTWTRQRGVHGFARSRGLREPYSHEPWHVERVLLAGP